MDDRRSTSWLETSELYPWSWLRVSGRFTRLSQWLSSCFGTRTIGNVEKLIPNLSNKTNYVVHYENLKLYENLGLKITKIHRGIKFQETAWLEEYINLNTKLRPKAKQSENDIEVDLFKLMNNSVFGKTLENIRNRVDIRLISSDKVAQTLASKPKLC